MRGPQSSSLAVTAGCRPLRALCASPQRRGTARAAGRTARAVRRSLRRGRRRRGPTIHDPARCRAAGAPDDPSGRHAPRESREAPPAASATGGAVRGASRHTTPPAPNGAQGNGMPVRHAAIRLPGCRSPRPVCRPARRRPGGDGCGPKVTAIFSSCETGTGIPIHTVLRLHHSRPSRRLTCDAENSLPAAVRWPSAASSAAISRRLRASPVRGFFRASRRASRTNSGCVSA